VALDGVRPGGSPVKLSAEGEMCGFGSCAGKVVPRGSRLTPERLAKMRIGTDFLTDTEKQLFIDILFEFEPVLAFDDSEMGLLNPDVEPPVEIHTVPHVPWQQQNLRLPKAMQEAASAILKKKLASGILEHSQGAYRNRYFLVAKKNPGEYRLINDVQPLNAVTIRDSCMPPSVDDFSEDFAGYPILTSVDMFSGYDQINLHECSRDFTAFMTDLGLLRCTRIPPGWANSVAVFMRVILKILWELVPDHARPFVDDVALKGPKSRYNDEEISPGVRGFVAEHAQLFRRLLWADRVSVRRSTGYTAFELVYGRDCLLPVEFSVESWSVVDWEGEVQSHEDLLLARMRQLDERVLSEVRAAENLRDSRLASKAYFDQTKNLRPESQQLHIGDLVLVHDTRHANDRSRSRKLGFPWFGPYRIREIAPNSMHYYLDELDGTQLKRSFAGNHLKRSFSRSVLDNARREIFETIRVRTDFENMPVEGDNEEEDGDDGT